MLVDTHCHIHELTYPLDASEVITHAHQAGVGTMICIGTNQQSSKEALDFAVRHDRVFAAIGVHPHDTREGWGGIADLVRFADTIHSENGFADAATQLDTAVDILLNEGAQQNSTGVTSKHQQRVTLGGAAPTESNNVSEVGADRVAGPASAEDHSLRKLVAIGEIGLDYFYTHSPRDIQIQALEEQIGLALQYNLPIIFHVRDAFDDFWSIFDNFHGIRGELHSFTDSTKNLEEGLKRGLFIGVNGISTFTKDINQMAMFARIPLEKMLLETDAPFLTPTPLRGKVNEPAFVRHVAEHQARLRGLSLQEIAATTSANAHALFALS